MAEKEVRLLPHQYEILTDTTTKILGCVSGYGGGKTYAACRKAIQLADLNRGFTGIVTEPTFPMLRDIFIPEMKLALEEWGISYKFNASSYIFTLSFGVFESKIICMSAENYERIVGINAAWAIMDEFDTSKTEVAMNAFNKILGRLRAGNTRQLVITTTPEGFKAAYRIFVEENKSGERRLIKAKTTDNKYLPADFIETLEAQYTPELLRAYLNGEFVNLQSGSVYPHFDRERHHAVVEVQEHEQIQVSMDFNYGGCCMTFAVERAGKDFTFKEATPKDTLEAIELLKSLYPPHRVIIFPDASGRSNSTNASRSDVGLLEEAGFRVDAPKANPRIEDRVNTVNVNFHNNNLFIDTLACPKTTQALEQHAYNEQGKPEKFNGAATIDDFTDSYGYRIHRKYAVTRTRVSASNMRFT